MNSFLTANHTYLLKYKRLSNFALKPMQQVESAGIDLSSPIDCRIEPKSTFTVKTDIAFEPPTGYYGRLASRSSIASNYAVEVIGGELKLNFFIIFE